MEPDDSGIMIVAGVIIGVMALIVTMQVIVPMIEDVGPVARLASRLSLGLETMAGIQDGTIKIPVEIDSRSYIKVSYEKKGNYDSFKIKEDGWYVIVTAKIEDNDITRVSRIYSYPEKDDTTLTSVMANPKAVCIQKETGELPKLTGCRL